MPSRRRLGGGLLRLHLLTGRGKKNKKPEPLLLPVVSVFWVNRDPDFMAFFCVIRMFQLGRIIGVLALRAEQVPTCLSASFDPRNLC